MEERREGIMEKSNQVMKEEASLTGSRVRGTRTETRRDWVTPEWRSLLQFGRGRRKGPKGDWRSQQGPEKEGSF